MNRFTGRLARNFGIAALFLLAALSGTAGGVLFAFVATSRRSRRSTTTRRAPSPASSARDGAVVGEFATERRVIVTYEDIPAVLRNAIVAAEDGSFFEHSGISVRRILVAAARRAMGCRAMRRGAARSRSSSRASCS